MSDSEKLDLILSKVQNIEHKITGIELHLENTTDKNILGVSNYFYPITLFITGPFSTFSSTIL